MRPGVAKAIARPVAASEKGLESVIPHIILVVERTLSRLDEGGPAREERDEKGGRQEWCGAAERSCIFL